MYCKKNSLKVYTKCLKYMSVDNVTYYKCKFGSLCDIFVSIFIMFPKSLFNYILTFMNLLQLILY